MNSNKFGSNNFTSSNFNTDNTEDDSIMVYQDFEDMKLRDELLRGIFAYGFEKPSKIQQRAIMPVISGRDVIAQAQSGTGKTATYSIGALQQINTSLNCVQTIILLNTRELAQQTTNVVLALGDYMNIKVHCCIGGTRLRDDINALKGGVHVVVGTPGRIYGMIKDGHLQTEKLKTVILDEADQMLDDLFKDAIKDIFQYVPQTSQICIFSATLQESVLSLTEQFMNNPIKILVKTEELTLEGIKQYLIYMEREDFKLETLCDIYNSISVSQTIIYVNTIMKAKYLDEELRKRKFTVALIHGEMEQNDRSKVIKEFRQGGSRILITTDLLARGIDIHQISVVINYDIPTNIPNYLHRIGRSGRFGRKGVAINFTTQKDQHLLRDIEKYYSTQIEDLPENFAKYI
jgi:translation initiation factor 4A